MQGGANNRADFATRNKLIEDIKVLPIMSPSEWEKARK